jgi:uncharacterized protein (TIGR03000 family)
MVPAVFVRRSLAGVLLLIGACGWEQAVWAAEPEKKPLTLEVRLPADAVLEVNGVRMKTPGEVRPFESTPLAVGKEYTYVLAATWRGKTVMRKVRLSHDRPNLVDLSKAWDEEGPAVGPAVRAKAPPRAPEPPPAIVLDVPSSVELMAGRSQSFPVRVRRERPEGPVVLNFEGLPPGVTASAVAIPASKDETTVELTAAATAAEGVKEVRLIGTSGKVTGAVTIRLRVVPRPMETKPAPTPAPKPPEKPKPAPAPAPEPKPSEKPKPAPEPAPKPPEKPKPAPEPRPEPKPEADKLVLEMPDHVSLLPGKSRHVEIRVRARGEASFEGEPSIELIEPEGNGVTCNIWLRSYRPRFPVCRWIYAIRADAAAAGEKEIRVRVTAGSQRAEGKVRVTVQPADKPSAK